MLKKSLSKAYHTQNFKQTSVANSVRVNNNLNINSLFINTHTLLITLAESATEAVITLSNLAQ